MTKYKMIKKFMKEFECSKQEATRLLRSSQWDYDKACSLIDMSDKLKELSKAIEDIDWNGIFRTILDAFTDAINVLKDIDWNDAVIKITEEKEREQYECNEHENN